MLRGRVVGLGLGRALAGDKSLPIPLGLHLPPPLPQQLKLIFELIFQIPPKMVNMVILVNGKYLGVVEFLQKMSQYLDFLAGL